MAIVQIVRSFLRLGLTIVFLIVLGPDLMALIYSWIISFTVSAVCQILILPISIRFAYQRPLLSEMLRFGFPLQMSRLLWFAFTQVHVLLLGTLAGPTSVAFYSVAARIPRAVHRLSESYIAVYFPTTAALISSGERGQAHQIFNRSLRIISFVAALVALAAVVFSREIITLFFSDKYAASSAAFALLMITFHVTFVLSIMGYTLTAAGYPGRSLGENLFRSTLTIVGDLVLIPIYGFMGPVFAGLIAAYAANPVAIALLRRSDITVVLAPYVKQTALLLLGTIIYWGIQPAGIVYKIAIVVIFVGLNILLATISRDDLDLVLPRVITKRLGTLIQDKTLKV
jgi:O-antigen/teichoic acid export membrane protein